ncbi:MAG: galactokinase [Actinomycetota bacterium]
MGRRSTGRHLAATRAPGRVNLIGEHTDYSLLPVLPMAIDRAVTVTAVQADHGVRAHSTSLGGLVRIDPDDKSPPTGWGRYVHAAVMALGGTRGRGALIEVGGDLPHTGGLSSSSALTIAVLAVLNDLWELALDPGGLVTAAVEAERASGVEGGSMDQTVIVHAVEGNALRIDFHPMQRRLVPLPPGLSIVIGYSGEPAAKGETARHSYNRMVVAARAAAVLIANHLPVPSPHPPVLASVAGRVGAEDAAAGLPHEVSANDAARRSGHPVEDLIRLSAADFDGNEPLPVRTVGQHVLAEAKRVDEAEASLLAGDLPSFGRLLDQSQASLERVGASTPGLDQVVKAFRRAGAYGARLTGAGFGGWAMAAVPSDLVDRTVAAARTASGHPAFEVRPSDGVQVERRYW